MQSYKGGLFQLGDVGFFTFLRFVLFYVYVCLSVPCSQGDQKVFVLDLALQMVVSQHVGAGNRTQALCNGSVYS